MGGLKAAAPPPSSSDPQRPAPGGRRLLVDLHVEVAGEARGVPPRPAVRPAVVVAVGGLLESAAEDLGRPRISGPAGRNRANRQHH